MPPSHDLPLKLLILAPLGLGLALTTPGAEARAERADPGETERPVDFLRDVRPILAERCLLCHGNDDDQGGVRLHTFEDATADLGGYAAVVPGDVENSELLWRVRAEDEAERMPPPDHDDPLTDAEVRILERWIADGAEWKEHWAFAPLERAAVPALAGVPPAGEDAAGAWAADWLAGAADPTNPVDPWIRAGLLERGLAPAPDAGDLVWLRRASFDLVGLPPTIAEQEAFLSDPAAERRALAADRLLASPHFGERWARHVLDIVRYAETRGHEYDFAIPNAWEYRDYLTRALNADVGWDQLVREHVAGDLLPEPRLSPEGWNESVVGTGFWHLGEAVHAPVDLEVDLADRTANQLDVFGKAFLGLTLACARCHDHKFDPIPTKDYYALSGYVQSASYRQVRFETLEEELALRHESDELWRTEESLGSHPEAKSPADKALERLELVAKSAEVARELVPELEAELLRWRAPRELFDFEPTGEGGTTWTDLGWTTEGAAFGSGPMLRSEVPDWYEHTSPDGLGFVNSHDSRQAPDSPESDALTGRLLSPFFALDRDRMRLRVAGGDHPGETEVRLLIDGEVVRTASGHDGGELRDAVWELDDLLTAPGADPREARLEVIDEHTTDWGHIILDSVRLEHAVDEALVAGRVAHDEPTTPEALLAWRRWLDEAPAPIEGPWVPEMSEEERVAFQESTRLLWRAGEDPWWQDGAAFTERGAGQPWLTGDEDRPIEALAPEGSGGGSAWPPPAFQGGAIGLDPAWLGLERAEVTTMEGTLVDWDGAGRTLRLPTFTLGEGSLWYLVRGKGVAFAPLEGHRTLSGPLHVETHLDFDTGHEWRWVEHPHMAGYPGLRAHVELSPADGASWVGIAAVGQGPVPPFPMDEAWRTRQVHDLLVARPELGGPLPPAGIVEREVAERRAALAARVPKVSRTAPALLDGNAVDQPVLVRGLATNPGEPAPRGYLERFRDRDALAPTHLDDGTPTSGRLELARSMLDRSGPLVARTFANRVWLLMMGRGLVPTPDNLGTLAAYPSHPELLDTLAAELVAHDWSLKHLARSIVLSRTYGLAAGDAGPELAPHLDEAWGRRGPKRLDAEAVRDAILRVSGSLDAAVGGPPVPVHLTEGMTGRGRPGKSGPIDGAGRRSLYLEVRRNFLIPFQLVWDFPQPATTMGKRSSSNVPAQALALMNDPFVVQEAERWAARLTDEVPADDLEPGGARIDRLWLVALGRAPLDAERDAALAWLRAADALIPRGDASAMEQHRRDVWTDLCHAVLQLKEFVHVP